MISFPYNVICCIVCSKSRALHGESPLVKGDLKRSYPKDPHSSSHSNSSSKSNSISPHPAGSQQHAHNPYSQSRCVYQQDISYAAKNWHHLQRIHTMRWSIP